MNPEIAFGIIIYLLIAAGYYQWLTLVGHTVKDVIFSLFWAPCILWAGAETILISLKIIRRGLLIR